MPEDKQKRRYRSAFDKPSIEKLKAEFKRQKNPFAQMMVELADKGADICNISNAIAQVPSEWKDSSLTYDMMIDLRRITLRKEKAVRNAFKLLTERLEPVFPDTLHGQRINSEIVKMQAALQQYTAVIERYHYLKLLEQCYDDLKRSLPYKTDNHISDIDLDVITKMFPPGNFRTMLKARLKPANQRTPWIWNYCIVTIVDEMKKTGCSAIEAFTQTGKLLHLAYPDIYKDPKPGLVKQRYTFTVV